MKNNTQQYIAMRDMKAWAKGHESYKTWELITYISKGSILRPNTINSRINNIDWEHEDNKDITKLTFGIFPYYFEPYFEEVKNIIARDILKMLFNDNLLFFHPENEDTIDFLETTMGSITFTIQQNMLLEKLHKERYTCGKCKEKIIGNFWNGTITFNDKEMHICQKCYYENEKYDHDKYMKISTEIIEKEDNSEK